ncbi:DeoR/GlpR family DNA-binding transcription regulator [Companilactobacillus halodurans]|uniref:DeoR/GlpR transcriptional regulator n=1 Tax=Companilactobacillus halodurans TaxID=2584183 RepID=A0A5P0ZY00_9LACO|nr:DeoR/GlpR family DNA-binding transcription regulator [Companilactobacillus halodurans]MQS75684.1 DeoR/GlpR transcriptional regulator [Companilactobacillus halodurans]MQS97668.1 DeoR/GlpR transcriptional regulator [Companilactobacillus halodurans]
MLQEQRLEEVLQLLKNKQVLTSEEMIEYFHVSRDTVRRDFEKLAQANQAKRVHGGIMRLENKPVASFNERLQDFNEAKNRIVKLALQLIEVNGIYFFDVSTTVLKLAQLLDTKTIVYTHSLDNSIMLSDNSSVDLHTLGGKFFSRNRFFYSINETQFLEDISFDVAFIGAAGLKNNRVTFADQEDAAVKKLALKHAKVKVLLAENTKFSKESTYSIGNLSDFDYLITDKEPAAKIKSLVKVKY